MAIGPGTTMSNALRSAICPIVTEKCLASATISDIMP